MARLRAAMRDASLASPAMRCLQMRVSSGMPSAVSPSARTEHGCMRQ
jgi:hypothetical protein